MISTVDKPKDIDISEAEVIVAVGRGASGEAMREAAKELADRLAAGEFATVEEFDAAIDGTIRRMLHSFGLPLDPTYTGKAYHGMECYLKDHQIENKRILFIHTGGTPLFYDWVML